MASAGTLTKFLASAALLMALTAFILGSAPFTPAMALAVIAIPIAAATFFLGMPSLSVTTIYWAVAALSSGPLSGWLQIRVDYMLLIQTGVGVAVSSILYLIHVRKKSAT
jgi:hypothetical protein